MTDLTMDPEPVPGLQAIAATGWGYSERELLGGWELRASGGFTSRANVAWPLGDSGRPLPETLAKVAQWYGGRGLPPLVQTVVGGDLDREIADLGHTGAVGASLRQTADLEPALAVLSATADPDLKSELSADLPADFVTVYRRGLGHPHSPAVLGTGDAEIRFAVIRDTDGAALAVGRTAVHPTARWTGVAAIHTAERARRRGLARVILRDLLTTAAQSGATRAYLEVEEDNAPARTLYESLGFRIAHRYHARVVG
jgi:N-acetylglutamate synthase